MFNPVAIQSKSNPFRSGSTYLVGKGEPIVSLSGFVSFFYILNNKCPA